MPGSSRAAPKGSAVAAVPRAPAAGTAMSRGTAVASVPSAVPGPVPEEHCHKLQNLIKPCIDSFNYMLEEGLALAVQDIPAQEVPLVAEGAAGPVLLFWLEDVQIGHPRKNDDSVDPRLFPGECRERELTYAAPLMATLCRRVGDGPVERVQRKLGDIPIMVKSGRCHLAGMGPADMVRRHEDAGELGGYFICNGIERCIRMLQMPRRNHIMAIERSSFGRRGPAFSNMATSIRCVRRDQSAVTVYLHYMHDGNAMVRFAVRKQEFFVPVVLMLKALKDTTDREIYEKLVRGDTSNTFLSDRVELILQDATKQALHTRRAVLSYLGSRFRAVLDVPASLPDEAVGASLLRRFLFVHLNDDADKYELLLLMLRKLYAFVSGDAKPDNADALMNHEILLPGHMYLIFLKEKLEEALLSIRNQMTRDLRIDASRVNLQDGAYFLRCVDRAPDIGRKLYYFLATGNLLSSTGLDLMQVSGYTIVAEKLNFLRYLSHFRSVHRGQFFSEMKTTAVRKLLPENWGFLCPVHTPDGAPCGLLNHFAANCLLVTRPGDAPHLPTLLSALGMTPSHGAGATALPHNYLPVVLDGKLLGGVHPRMAQQLADELRLLKVNGERGVPAELEIAAVMPGRGGGCYPGIYLFLCSARMLRPVVHLKSGKVELIGPFEQVFMEIACQEADIRADTTHREIDPTNILSVVASLTPFSDFNQSPRNMYQCQMGKQTMGTPCHNWSHRVDNKMYRIQSPQVPLVQTRAQREYRIDEYPSGTNAVVAVISYTGYDMEDAMILNKASYERGFGHGTVYKTKVVDLVEEGERSRGSKLRFGLPADGGARRRAGAGKEAGDAHADTVGADGLPIVGQLLREGDAMYCVVDDVTGRARYGKHKESEPAVVDEVRLLGADANKQLQKISIKLRFNRNPVVGDKFSSRHGQKGVLSVLWPQQDMPFSESGITPDVIINPHAFPSRMTIGMLIESMAAKSGALHGIFQDATPFRFHEQQRAVDYFGEQLRAAGYHYYGSEPLYSGVSGTEMHADIFIGVVYYQRLRHMVSDKSQVRATGPTNPLTRQPVKGRKRHGGIRFGEMERDSLLAHGVGFLLQDRLMNCSDRHVAIVCKRCGSLLSPLATRPQPGGDRRKDYMCRICNTRKTCAAVALPYVFRYLANELAAMNIRLTLDVQ